MKYSRCRKQIMLDIIMYEYGEFVDEKIIRRIVKYACRLEHDALNIARSALKNIVMQTLL